MVAMTVLSEQTNSTVSVCKKLNAVCSELTKNGPIRSIMVRYRLVTGKDIGAFNQVIFGVFPDDI
jgi:hypothetical protein